MSLATARHLRQRAPGRASVYDATILAAGPVAYFTLGGGSAGLADRTGHEHQGNHTGGFHLTDFPDGSVASVLDGGSQYIEVPSHPKLSVATTGALTIEAWIRPDVLQFASSEASGYVHWMGKGAPGNYEYVARMYSLSNAENRPNRISGYAFNLAGGLGAGSYFQDNVTVGAWIHYVLVINSLNTSSQYTTGYTKIYKNGVERDKDALSGYGIIPQIGNAPFRIGTRDFNSFFQGAVGKVAIYDYELSPVTIREHYHMIVPPLYGTTGFLGHVGDATTKTSGTKLAVPVGASGVPAGSTLLVKVAHDYTSGGPTILDSRGNLYTRDQSSPSTGNTMRASIFSAPIHSALLPGDTILLTTSSSVAAKAMSIDAFSGILLAGNIDQKNSNGAISSTPGTTTSIVPTQADSLLSGFVAVNGPLTEAYTEDISDPWNSLPRIGTSGAGSNITLNSAYRPVGTTGTYRYRPTLGTTQNWVGILANYKAGTPIIVPPAMGTAYLIDHIGRATATSVGTVLTISVPAEGIPTGHTLLVRVLTDFTITGPTITDTRGNIYTRDRTAPNTDNTMRASIFSCPITTALQGGDTITITTPSAVNRAAVADSFANVLHPITIDQQNGNSNTSAAPSLAITTTQTNSLLVGFVGVLGANNEPYLEDTFRQWTSLTRTGTLGGAGTDKTINSAYRSVGAAGTYTYAPTLGSNTSWIEFIIAYRAA